MYSKVTLNRPELKKNGLAIVQKSWMRDILTLIKMRINESQSWVKVEKGVAKCQWKESDLSFSYSIWLISSQTRDKKLIIKIPKRHWNYRITKFKNSKVIPPRASFLLLLPHIDSILYTKKGGKPYPSLTLHFICLKLQPSGVFCAPNLLRLTPIFQDLRWSLTLKVDYVLNIGQKDTKVL